MGPEIVGLMLATAVGVFAVGHASGRTIGHETGRLKGILQERARNEVLLDAKQRYIDMLEVQVRRMERQRDPLRQAQTGWRAVLGFASFAHVTREDINRAYHDLAKTRHPDRGGSTDAMAALNVARAAALKEVVA